MQYSPEPVELVEACHEVQTTRVTWKRVKAAASAYAKANGSDNFKIEQLLIPEHRRCACACCGHQHCVIRQPGFYFNGKSLQDLLIDEAKKAELATT